MTQSDKKAEQAIADRRSFLKLAGAGAVTGGVAATAAATTADASPRDPDHGDYRETAHIKRYYDLARF